MIPGGLGGPPNRPLYAGQTAYAVIDLNPTGATTSALPGLDEMNVLADSTWPNEQMRELFSEVGRMGQDSVPELR